MTAALTRVETPIGAALLVTVDGAAAILEFEDRPERLDRALRRRGMAMPGPGPSPHAAALVAYFAGELRAIDAVPVAQAGTAFQQLAWSALRAVPAGETSSYAGLAAAIGRPGAVRAVGAANGANALAVLVPCHRLVGSDGALTGYGGGLARKAWLLEHERRWAAVDQAGRTQAAPSRSMASMRSAS